MFNDKLMAKVNVPNTDYQMKMVPGMTETGYLDPKTKKELSAMMNPSSEKPAGPVSIAELRKNMGWKTAHYECQNELEITNMTIKDVPVRIYAQKVVKDETLPTVLFIHGGGFVGGDLDNVELPCEALADLGKIRIISVDYSLAPEHPYPQAVIDCYQVLNYLNQNKTEMGIGDITVMGDSAGGNLTYVMSLLDIQMGTHFINKAITLYPVVYQGQQPKPFDSLKAIKINENAKEMEAFIHGFLDDSMIKDMYLVKNDPESIYISPLNAPDSMLKQMPKTLFMVGEFDPLRLQGEAFYNKMKLAGGDITYIRYNGMSHAFMDKMGDFVQAKDSMMEAVKFILE